MKFSGLLTRLLARSGARKETAAKSWEISRNCNAILKRTVPFGTYRSDFVDLTAAVSKCLNDWTSLEQFHVDFLIAAYCITTVRYLDCDAVKLRCSHTARADVTSQLCIALDFRYDRPVRVLIQEIRLQLARRSAKSPGPAFDVSKQVDTTAEISLCWNETRQAEGRLNSPTAAPLLDPEDCLGLFVDTALSQLNLSLLSRHEDFDGDLSVQFLEHLSELAKALPLRLDSPISSISILSDEEYAELIRVGDGGMQRDPGGAAIQDLFLSHALVAPSREAITHCERRFTYGELERASARVAARLVKAGISDGAPVALVIERSVEALIGIIGILRAGGAYVPISSTYPQERVEYIITDAGARLVLTDLESAAAVARLKVPCLRLEDILSSAPDSGFSDDQLTARPVEKPALILYTSGTSGRPKGVVVTHANLLNLYFCYAREYGYETWKPTVGQVAFFAFADFQADWVRALGSGGRLVICSQAALMSPSRLYDTFRAEQVDSAQFVPPLLRELIAYVTSQGKDLTFLRFLGVGGDRWYVREHTQLTGLCGGACRVVSIYGSSETTVDNTLYENGTTNYPPDALVPVGTPFPNTGLYVMDRAMRLKPVGTTGELVVAGVCVTAGYANQPDLTSEKFHHLPFLLDRGWRMYRTGDLAKVRSDGTIAFLGRKDHQIKINGVRIELGEIEGVMSEHPDIHACVVSVRAVTATNLRLIAYYVTKSGSPLANPREFLASKLPNAMIPAEFIAIQTMPLTSSGKIDRRALPTPAETGGEADCPQLATQSCDSLDEMIAGIDAKCLNRRSVGLDQDFYHLGGDSMTIVAILAQIEDELGVTLRDEDLKPETFVTVGALSRQIRALLGSSHEPFQRQR